MSIKQNGGVFGRNPTFNDVTIEGDLIINGEVFTGLDFQGSWNASTNSPTLASSVGTNGEFYIVSIAGTTDLNGITNWGIGDWAIFNGTVWQRVEGGADGNFNDLTANSLNVDGTATMDGLTVDGGATSPTHSLIGSRAGTLVSIDNQSASTSYGLRLNIASVSASSYPLWVESDDKNRFVVKGNGDISFYEDTGTTAKFFWDASAESLGIGTSSPNATLDLEDTVSGSPKMRLTSTSAGNPAIEFRAADSWQIQSKAFAASSYTLDINYNRADYNGGVTFSDNGTERMRITGSGNVGIGTSSPHGLTHWESATGTVNLIATNDAANGIANTTVMSLIGQARSVNNDLSKLASIDFRTDPTTWYKGNITFNVANADGTNPALTPLEAMRIDASGNVLVGKTAVDFGSAQGFEVRSTGNTYITAPSVQALRLNRTGTDGDILAFKKDGTTVGSVSVTGSATAYNTSSDYRLKEDDVAITGATERVKALRPINFAWKVDGSRVDGFLAHEAQEVVPESVTGSKDAMQDEEYEVTAAVYEDVTTPAVEAVLDEDGVVITEAVAETIESVLVSEAVMGTRSVPDYQGIDQSKLVPLLTAALQEAITKIEALTTRIETLEGQ